MKTTPEHRNNWRLWSRKYGQDGSIELHPDQQSYITNAGLIEFLDDITTLESALKVAREGLKTVERQAAYDENKAWCNNDRKHFEFYAPFVRQEIQKIDAILNQAQEKK